MNLLAELRARLAQALDGLVDDVAPYVGMLRPANDLRFGDFQANCAMSLGKVLGKAAARCGSTARHADERRRPL
jgi:arginyl-tRNA synthetase